jgi:peptide/nickel transport system substrate-binding protein
LLVWLAIAPRLEASAQQAPLDHSRPRPRGGWYVGALPEPEHLNPFTTKGYVARGQILRYTHDTLMRLDPETAEPLDSLAERVQTSRDGRQVVFRLRRDARFSDGSPVTVADVLFTWEVVQDQSVPVGGIAGAMVRIRRVQALGGNTFRVDLNESYFAGVAAMALDYPVVKRQYFLDEIRKLAVWEKAPVPTAPGRPGFGKYLAMVRRPGPGTGPYRLANWFKGEELSLVQNLHSWHRRVYPESWNLAGIKVRFITDRAARFAAWRNQQIDWHYDADPERLLAQNPETARRYQLHRYDPVSKGHEMGVWNHEKPHLRDKRVRRALTMLFNREDIGQKLLHGLGTPAVAWFKPGQPEYPARLRPWPFDPDAARKLLAEAGYTSAKPLTVEILAIQGQDLYRRILEAAAPAFEQAGVQLVATGVTGSDLVARRGRGDWDGYLMQWSHGGPFIDPFDVFHSSQIGAAGMNKGAYRNKKVDEILARARQEMDQDARVKLFQQFNSIFHEEQPITLLVHLRSAILLHRRFQDATPGALGLVPQRWWVRPEDRR